jgi:hypothetical protein
MTILAKACNLEVDVTNTLSKEDSTAISFKEEENG